MLRAANGGYPWVVKADAISAWTAANPTRPENGSSIVVRDVGGLAVVETMPEIAAKIAEAQGGGEAEQVLAWLEGATDEFRQICSEDGVYRACITTGPLREYYANTAVTAHGAIAAVEAQRNAS
jgi:hypothetical protein